MFATFLGYFVGALCEVLFWAIVARSLMSWFPVRPGNPFHPLAVILYQITEPILGPLRRIIPTIGMIDISPVVALILLQLLRAQVDSAIRAMATGF